MIDNLIIRLIDLEGNSVSSLSLESQRHFLELIVQISRIKFGVRYHDLNRMCQCQPEYKIRELLIDDELEDYLKQEKVYDDIQELLNNPINKDKTIWEVIKE